MIELLDTHMHLMYSQHFAYSWATDIDALSPPDFSFKDYKQLAKAGGVTRSVFMEVGVDDDDYQAEANTIRSLVEAESGELNGVIASCRPESDDGFDSWLAHCQDLQVCGFRRILHVVPDEMSATTTFRNNVRKIGDAGLVFDVCMMESQLALAVDLAEYCDNTPLVLNHCGVPSIAEGSFTTWANAINNVANCPNVNVKISGISAYCAPGESSLDTLKPYMDHVLAAFGPQRVVWGSDYPVVNMAEGLPRWLEVTQTWLSTLPESVAQQIAYANAERIYNID